MKKFILFLTTFFLFFACNVSENLLKRGEYHQAVLEAVKKIRRNPKNEKQIKILEQAYPLAEKKDLERIKFLQQQGQPDRWDEIYSLYKNLKERQDLVESISPIKYRNGKVVKFQHKDYNSKIIEAKRKAALYHYTLGKKLMQSNDKYSYRKAYYEFQKAKEYNPSYYDVDSLMQVCYERGQTYAILIVQNSTIYKLSDDFLINLIDFPVGQLNTMWIKYFNTDVRKGNYDISIYIILKIADVSPDNLDQKIKVYEKKIEDGYEYKTDGHGHILKDSLGNPIKVKKYKTISCQFKTFRQFKAAHIEGEIRYVDNHTKQSLLQIPIAADHIFENYYYVANGDLDALPSSKRRLLDRNRPVPYPHPLDLIYAANETLKHVIFDALMDNRDFLEQNF